MTLFDIFKSRRSAPPELREALIEAAHQQNSPLLAKLCERHQEEIRRMFPTWRQVPEPLRNDPTARDRYCRGLLAVAALFEDAGDSSLIQLLTGHDADNPLVRWEQDLSEAQSLIDRGRPEEAVGLLGATIERVQELSGDGVATYMPRTLGSLGAAYYRSGDHANAVEFTRKALEMCKQVGDNEGVEVYSRNLEHVEQGSTVIFRGADGRTLKISDLKGGVTGAVRYEISDGQGVPAEAESLHRKAREAGERGDHKKAIVLLDQASQVAPQWPYPVYDKAYEYLLMKDFGAALMYYQKTVELAPRGFFTAITAVDTLTREQEGELPSGTYFAYVLLDGMSEPSQRAAATRTLLNRVPDFAPGWKTLAALSDDDTERLAIIEKGLAAHPDPETRGMLQINKALILNLKGNHDGAVRLLGELVLDPNSTFGTEHSAKAALAIMTKQ